MEEGDRVLVRTPEAQYEGILMPTVDPSYVVVKLDNGYNISMKRDGVEVTVLERKAVPPGPIVAPPPQDPGLPMVSILSTGGTIASKVDYRTGAVTSKFTAEDILLAIPELTEVASFHAEVVYQILSENMRAEYWQTLARAIHREIEDGAEGIMVTHGTDTMTYTAAALSFMLQTPVPIVMVGSQRSADRPSSDNVMNAICAATVASSDIAEVSVVMHGTTTDDYSLVHRGTKVRKMHTSARYAFQSINSDPLAKVHYPSREIEILSHYITRGERELALDDRLDDRCALVKYTPGASPSILDYFVENYHGIVIEGTGLGHVSTDWIPSIKNAHEAGIPVVVTSQCLYGRVNDRVYDTGRDMLSAGVIEGEDMLPEVALVKLMWALGHTSDLDEVRDIMTTPLVGEITREVRR